MHRVLNRLSRPSSLHRRSASAFTRFRTPTSTPPRPLNLRLCGSSSLLLQQGPSLNTPQARGFVAQPPRTERRTPSLRLRDHWPFLYLDSACAAPPRLRLLGPHFLDPTRPIAERVKVSVALAAAETIFVSGLFATQIGAQACFNISNSYAALSVTVIYMLVHFRSHPRLLFPFTIKRVGVIGSLLLPVGALVLLLAGTVLLVAEYDLDCTPNPGTEMMNRLAKIDAAERKSREAGVSPATPAVSMLAKAVPLVVLLAPIQEEIFFRVLLFARLAAVSGLLPAYVISSLAFGAAHGGTNAQQVIVPWREALAGGMLAGVYHATGRVWPSVLMHMCNNSLAVFTTAATEDQRYECLLLWLVRGFGKARLELSRAFPELWAIGDSNSVYAGEPTSETKEVHELWFDALYGADGINDEEGSGLEDLTLYTFRGLADETESDLIANLVDSAPALDYHNRQRYRNVYPECMLGQNKHQFINDELCVYTAVSALLPSRIAFNMHQEKTGVLAALIGARTTGDPELARVRSILQPIIISHDRESGEASTQLRDALIDLQPKLQQLTHARVRKELARRLSKDSMLSMSMAAKGLTKPIAAELLQEWLVAHPQFVLEDGLLKVGRQPGGIAK